MHDLIRFPGCGGVKTGIVIFFSLFLWGFPLGDMLSVMQCLYATRECYHRKTLRHKHKVSAQLVTYHTLHS